MNIYKIRTLVTFNTCVEDDDKDAMDCNCEKHDYNDYDKHDHDDYDTHDREYNYVIHIPFHATSKGIYSFHMVQSLNPTNIQEWIGK